MGVIGVINQFDEKKKRIIDDTTGVFYINKMES